MVWITNRYRQNSPTQPVSLGHQTWVGSRWAGSLRPYLPETQPPLKLWNCPREGTLHTGNLCIPWCHHDTPLPYPHSLQQEMNEKKGQEGKQMHHQPRHISRCIHLQGVRKNQRGLSLNISCFLLFSRPGTQSALRCSSTYSPMATPSKERDAHTVGKLANRWLEKGSMIAECPCAMFIQMFRMRVCLWWEENNNHSQIEGRGRVRQNFQASNII